MLTAYLFVKRFQPNPCQVKGLRVFAEAAMPSADETFRVSHIVECPAQGAELNVGFLNHTVRPFRLSEIHHNCPFNAPPTLEGYTLLYTRFYGGYPHYCRELAVSLVVEQPLLTYHSQSGYIRLHF